jgi:hypothetical protein
MALTKIDNQNISDEAITTSKISGTVALSNIPKITNVSIANSSYTILDDTAVNIGGGYIVITGSKFATGAQVIIGDVPALSTTYVNSTTLRAQVDSANAATYNLYVVNTDGSTGLKLNGLTYSTQTTWSTSSSLSQQIIDVPFTINLSANSDSNITYSNTTTLPEGTNLLSNGYFYGTVTGIESDTTYNFTVRAIDEENQESDRTFSMTVLATSSPTAIDILVVSGGGGGGDRHGGGGGAGGYIAQNSTSISTSTTYNIVIGGGGVGGNYESVTGGSVRGSGAKGTQSSFIGGAISIQPYAGGGGGTYDGNPSDTPFGSGGGGGGNNRPGLPGTAGQGNNGGNGGIPDSGGGGGADAVGGNAPTGYGGNGKQWLDGNYYGGGGGGAWQSSSGPSTPGGLGGGGNGAWDITGISGGTTNTGGGGGGSRSNTEPSAGQNGGSGVVIIRYPSSFLDAVSTTGSPTFTTSGGYKYYKFTGSGSITW